MMMCVNSGSVSHDKKEDAETVKQSAAQFVSVSTQAKPSLSSAEIMRNRMAFFSVPSQPVRINAKAFLGLEPPPASKLAEQEQDIDFKDTSEKPVEREEKPTEIVPQEQEPTPPKDADVNRKRHGRREPAERAKRWRKRRKKRRVTGHVTGASLAEKHDALPVVSIEGVSSDEDEAGVGLANVGEDVIDKGCELSTEHVAAIDDTLDEMRYLAENVGKDDRQLEIDLPSALDDKNQVSQGEVASLSEERQELEVIGGQGSPEEASMTICDAADDLSDSGSEIVDELCMNIDDDNDDDANGTEYLIDGRTINYDKLFAEKSQSREELEVDLRCEEEQHVVDNVVASFREIGDVQPPADVTNLPLTQSEERLLMFGWKEGFEDDSGDGVTVPEVPEVDEGTDEVIRVSGMEVTFEGKDKGVKPVDSAVRGSAPSDVVVSSSEHGQTYQPPSESPDHTAVALAPAEMLAPHADVDSFSDEDLELDVMVPSYPPAPAEVSSIVADAVAATEVSAVDDTSRVDEHQNLDASSNVDSLVATSADDSVNISDVAAANVSSEFCRQTEASNSELVAEVGVQVSMQSLATDLKEQSAELTDSQETNTVPLRVEETVDVQKKHDLEGAVNFATHHSPVLSDQAAAPVSVRSVQAAKLDPIARIDRLLESLSSSRVGPISPSLLRSDDFAFAKEPSGKYELDSDLTKAELSVSPSSRLDGLADSSMSDQAAETSDVKDESRIVEFTVEDESGVEQSFRVDESFVSTRDKRQRHFSEKESLSDVSFSATDYAADQSITCRNTDESSSSGTQEIVTCPAALMAATDDSLSLDRLASFSFDDILSVDNIDDGKSQTNDLSDVAELSDQRKSSKPVCNGTLHKEPTDVVSRREQNELLATVADAAARKDSPPVAVVSPSRLVDAKRRFFCEPPQPVRIDPRRVFDEIPASKTAQYNSSIGKTSGSNKQQQVNGLTFGASDMVEDLSSSEQPKRRILPALPPGQPVLDASEIILSAEEIALIKSTQQRSLQSTHKNVVSKSSQSPAPVREDSLVQRRLHRSEKKRPSSALVVTATEQEMGSFVPSSQTPSSTSKPPAAPQRQSSFSDSTTDGSPSQRRDRIWAFSRPKSSKTKVPPEVGAGGDTENSGGSDRKDKKRSLLALLMPSKSVDRRDKSLKDSPPVIPQTSAIDTTTAEPSVDRTEMIAAVREKTKSLPLEKKKLPAVPTTDAVKRASLEKQRSKSSKSRGSKKSESEGDGRSKLTQRTVYEEMAPIIEGIKRVERRNRDKVNIHDRIRAVAPPPAKAPFTALLPPKADSKC